MFNSIFIQDQPYHGQAYGPEERGEIARRTLVLGDVPAPGVGKAGLKDLARADFLFTGWGPPDLVSLLPRMPRLKVVFYAGGSANFVLHPDLWERGVQITSAYAANAVPVAEYALAAIILGLKQGWTAIMDFKLARRYERPLEATGPYRSTVGLISCGVIARELLRLLRAFDLRVLVHDPYLSAAEIHALGGEAAELETIFEHSDVVSLHTPELEETRQMIGSRHFMRMKPRAAFINTARGSIVREKELYHAARLRPDLQFILDVISPEPPPAESPLFTLPNVIVTPHIAGAMGNECRRMGRCMVEEMRRYLNGEPLRWLITPSLAAISSHRPSFMTPPRVKGHPPREHPSLALSPGISSV